MLHNTINTTQYYKITSQFQIKLKLCTCINAGLLRVAKAMFFGTGGNTAEILQIKFADLRYFLLHEHSH